MNGLHDPLTSYFPLTCNLFPKARDEKGEQVEKTSEWGVNSGE